MWFCLSVHFDKVTVRPIAHWGEERRRGGTANWTGPRELLIFTTRGASAWKTLPSQSEDYNPCLTGSKTLPMLAFGFICWRFEAHRVNWKLSVQWDCSPYVGRPSKKRQKNVAVALTATHFPSAFVTSFLLFQPNSCQDPSCPKGFLLQLEVVFKPHSRGEQFFCLMSVKETDW